MVPAIPVPFPFREAYEVMVMTELVDAKDLGPDIEYFDATDVAVLSER